MPVPLIESLCTIYEVLVNRIASFNFLPGATRVDHYKGKPINHLHLEQNHLLTDFRRNTFTLILLETTLLAPDTEASKV